MNTAKSTFTFDSIKLNRIGLGTNRLTDNEQTQVLLRNALEIGVNFIDTADIYQNGQSEITIGKVLAPYSKQLVIASKGGMVRDADPNNTPAYLQAALDASLQRLKLDCLTLYQLHRVSREVPLMETMETLKGFQQQGKIRHIGLSDVSIEQIETARQVVEIVSVQNHYSLTERKHEAVVDYCEQHNIMFIPWFPLDRGAIHTKTLAELAQKYQASVQQIALAWLLKRSPVMLPIPGTLSVQHLQENNAANRIELSDTDFQKLL